MNENYQPAMETQTPQPQKKKPRIWLIIVIVVAALLVLRGILSLGAMGLLMADSFLSRVQTDIDPAHYLDYMGENAQKEYQGKWMDETIFPDSLEGLDVLEYKMVYYNPWDAQFLSYLTVQYDEAGYAREKARLATHAQDAYWGIYGASGFAGEPPLAMDADEYYGFIYAIPTPGKKNAVTYVILAFCNYQYDMDYRSMIPEGYLPVGFDARPGNAWQKSHE